jgi:hypothetical protein
MFREWREDWVKAKTRPIGTRNRESLRLNVGNAKALEEAAARVAPVPAKGPAAAKAKRQPQKSAFYGKLQEKATAPVSTSPPFVPGGLTPNYSALQGPQSPVYAPGTPQYGATPPYAPSSPVYNPTTPNYGAQPGSNV